MSKSNEFFPTIGELADQAHKNEETAEGDAGNEEQEEKVVQEIESLCMKCHEQVCIPRLIRFFKLNVSVLSWC